MATEIGDLNVIQDEDTLRRMWQQTEDFGRKKEIRLRMYRLREERLKSYYITRESTNSTVTDHKTSTTSHAESLSDQGFLTMKTKEIRDSASPTLDLKQSAPQLMQICSSSSTNTANADHQHQQSSRIEEDIKSSYSRQEINRQQEYENANFQKSSHYASTSEWEPSSYDLEYENNKLNKNIVVDAQTNAAETEQQNIRGEKMLTISHSSRENYDPKTTDSPSSIRYENTVSRSEYSSENRVTEPTQKLIPILDNRTSITADNIEERMRNDISESKCESKSTNTLEINRNSTSSVDVANVDNSIMNELHKLDSYLSKEAISVPSAHSSPRPRTPDRDIISSAKNEADYATTYQQAYTNKISQDISLTHNAFASSLRASPTLSGKRSSSERSSPEKSTRVSPEKYPTYTTTNDSSRNVRVRNRASTSECDSDDSSATYNKKMGKKVTSSISIATKRTEKVESTVRRHHHQQQQHRETEFSSEGSVERETKKYAKSPKSSPERSAFKPVKMATSETHDFQAEVRRQSFPQTPVVVSDKTQKRRIHADERSYSENISNVRSSYRKSPESDVTKNNRTKTTETNKTRTSPQRGSRGVVTPAKSARVVSPAKMADKTEYTASYTSPSLSPSPPPRSRIQSPQKIPYDYTSIRPQSQPQSYKSSPVAPSNETFITSTKIEPQYRAVSQTTASSPSSNVTLMPNNKSKKSASTESHKATTTPSKTIRKSATSPPKTNGVVKKSSKPKQSKEESQSESSETESSSSENSDAEENQVTIEEITESATASTLDDLIESDDRIQQKLKSVDEFDLIKEEKTTPLANTTKAANEEFLKQERIVKEGEIDGSIPPPEVVLGKEAAKLLIDSFAPKEREQAQKNANSKESNIQVKQKSSEGKFVKKQQSNRVMSATSESIDDKEKPTTKKNVVTLDKQQTSTKKSGTLQDDNFLKKEIISKKQIEKKSSKSNLKKATTTSEKAPRLMVTNIGRLNNKSAAAATTSITTKASMTNPKNYQQQQQRTPKRIDSKNALKESSNETISRSNPDKVGKINETKIFKKYKSDKDVYKKQSETNKKYRRTESDKPLKADKVKTPLTIQNQNKTSSRSLNGYEKSSLSSRNKQINAQHGETIKENVSKSKTNYDRKETPSKNIGTVKILKSNTKNVKTQETAVKPKTLLFSSSTNHSTTKSSVPGYAMPRKTTTSRTKSDETAITKQSRTNQESNTNNVTTLKRNAFPSSNRTRKDTPKPQQITISVSSLSKDKKVKKNSTIKSEIFETTSSSSSSIIDLIDVDAIDGEDAEEKATEVIDVAETISKARDEKPEPRSSVSDSQHLNVIVRMPSSSRETTPKMNEEQFCTVTDEGDSPRYADKVIEPEDVEMVKRITIPRFEKITDLDENEDEEGDETTRNVSVADRVSKFLENASCASDTSKDVHSKQANVVDQVFQNQQTVNKTKEIFESIAKSSKTPAPPPIINRPSIFEHKRLNESIEEEDETVSSATHYGHDGPHKIVSKKLIPQDYQDYVMERQSKHEVESTTHDQNDSNFVTNEKQELEKEITESKKSVHNVGTKSDRENMIDTSMKLESSTHKEGKSDRPKAFSAVECQRYEKKNSHQEIDETSCKSKSPTRAKQHSQHSPTAAEVKPKTKSKESSPTRDYSTTKSNKRVNTLHQSDSISKKEKDDVIRKTIQRYESRKFSDKLSPKPIEITTVEVRPSKRIYDHTAITTVDACQDKYKTSSSDKRELHEEGKSMAKVSSSSKASNPAKETPLRHKTSPSPPRTAQTNDKFITSTKTDDYENRKQFFEAKGRKDSEKHIEHYRNDTTASTLHRKSPERPHTKRLSPEKNVNASRRTTESINTSTTTIREKWSPEKLATPFGVSLKKTVTSSPTQRKTPNTDGLTEEEKKVEEIFDLELLEAMLEKAVRYDLRSRIRAQIRLIRRQMELKKTSRTPSPEKSPTNEAKRTTSSQSKITSKETTQSIIDRRDKVKKRLFADDSSKDKLDGKIREQTPPSDRFTKSENSSKKPVNIVKCKSPARENNVQTTYQKDFGSSVRSKKGETHSTTERIISGYGVGPTDDKGKPLFGLKALRALNDADNKSSTRKDYNDGTVIKRRESHEITDHAGKPLFGLKALQRPSQQSQSYVNTTSSTSSVRHSNSSQDTNDKFNTSNTVYSSRTTMKSDSSGNVSFSRDEVKGEIHAKNGEQPSGTMTRNQVTYEKPRNKEATVRTSSATRTLNGSEEKGHSSRTQDVNSDSDYLNSESRRSSAGDDSWKSKFNSSSLIRRISNQHFEQAQRKFNASQTSTDENRRDSSEKHDSKCKPFSTNQRSSEKSINAQFLRTERNDDEFDEGKTQIGQASSFKDVKSKLQQATVSSSMKQVAKFVDDRQDKESSAKTTAENDFTFKSNNDSKAKSRFEHFDQTSKSTSSFSQHSKLSDNNQSFSSTTSHEAIQRVSATGTSAGQLTDEEKQAVSMLNRFVGGSVSLQELEVMSPTNSDTFSTSVDKFENQNKTNKNSRELDINQICDEEELRNLLEDCTDYEKRRLIRTKLRNIMADRKGCTELVQSDDKAGTNITHNANESNEIAETSSTTIATKSETFSSSVHVHSKTSSTGRIIKANSVTSPFAKFRQLERQNSLPSSGAPIFKFTDPKLTRSASSIKDRLLNWVKAQTKDYKNIQIDNFSTSWNNGLAFCALIHHFCPHAFDYNKLTPEQRRYNFELAFRVAEQEAGIVPLLDVEDMVIMKRPDWKCVFTYVQSVYQRFHASPEANRP